jgi:hypothetical protein
MATQASSGPVTFNEQEYHGISAAIMSAYRRNCRVLFGPLEDLDRIRWISEFRAFKLVIAMSMCSLTDENMARVNYCRFILLPKANYHEVTTRLCREMEEYFYGAREKWSWEKQTANFLELKEAREQVCNAWKRDLETGASAGLGGGSADAGEA